MKAASEKEFRGRGRRACQLASRPFLFFSLSLSLSGVVTLMDKIYAFTDFKTANPWLTEQRILFKFVETEKEKKRKEKTI